MIMPYNDKARAELPSKLAAMLDDPSYRLNYDKQSRSFQAFEIVGSKACLMFETQSDEDFFDYVKGLYDLNDLCAAY